MLEQVDEANIPSYSMVQLANHMQLPENHVDQKPEIEHSQLIITKAIEDQESD